MKFEIVEIKGMCSFQVFAFTATLLVLGMPDAVTGQTFKCVGCTNFCLLLGMFSLLYPILGRVVDCLTRKAR